MSLFYITVPTREYELILRQREFMIEDVHHVETPPNSTRNSVDEGNASGKFSISDYYTGTKDGRPAEIIVGDDFMEIRDAGVVFTPKKDRKSSTDDEDVEAEIHKFFLEKHLEDTLIIYKIVNTLRGRTNENRTTYCSFSVPAAMADSIIRRLQSVGIGSKYESSFIVCSANVYCGPAGETKKDGGGEEGAEDTENTSAWAEFVKSIKSRLTVAQVVSQIQSNAVLSFDFLMFVIVAAVIACLGLLEDNTVMLVASMLISPLMVVALEACSYYLRAVTQGISAVQGPIMAITFGSMIRDCALLKCGFKSELIGLWICLVIGFMFGIVLETRAFKGPWAGVPQWPTYEMTSRGKTRSLVVGVMMAVPSGIGVALSILAGNAGSLVGVAIAASLLPPAVNCGLFWGLACSIWFRAGINTGVWRESCQTSLGMNSTTNHVPVYCKNIIDEFAYLGIISFALTVINIVVIFLVAILILKIKEVSPYTTKSSLRKFWHEDLARTRMYNVEHGNTDIKQGIVNDLEMVDNQEEIHQALNQDPLIKRIHTRAGGTGEIAVLEDLRQRRNTEIVLPRMKQRAPVLTKSQSKGGGWFTGWWGTGKPVKKSKVTVA